MIGFRDSVTLARTKLRTKRTRLIVTVVVSGLVFGLAIGGIAIFSGVAASLNDYAHEQFQGTYFVSATSSDAAENGYLNETDPKRIARVKQLHKEYVAERTAAAKRLGLAYDPSTEVQPTEKDVWSDGEMLNLGSVAGQRENEEYYAKLLKDSVGANFESVVRDQASVYKPTYIFELTKSSMSGAPLMDKGLESFGIDSTNPRSADPYMSMQEMNNLDEIGYRFTDRPIVDSYVLPENDRRREAPNAIPVITPLDVAIKAFKTTNEIPTRPEKAEELSAWMKSVRTILNGQTYSVCYRNDASQNLVQQAVDQKKDIAAGKDQPGYLAPSVTYSLPAADSCGPVTVTDSRSVTEQNNDKAQLEFDALANEKSAEPQQQKLTFVLVGFSPEMPDYTAGIDLKAFVSSFVGMNGIYSNLIPRDMYGKLSEEAKHSDILMAEAASNQEKYNAALGREFLVAFGSVEQAKSYIADKGCSLDQTYSPSGCGADKPQVLTAFGTNYMAIDEVARYARPTLFVLLSIVGLVAAIIIMAMMGRVMADSRRETAVFRAIGAKRSDIAKIYVLYAIAVAGRIAMFAGLLGLTLAAVLEALYATRASYYAETVFGVYESSARFHFVGLNVYILIILAGIILLGLVGVSLPLMRNIRRNPIQDMREE